jgi:phenylpropionate dioxygenase-like ring-hydroxylating dioxygenase large terminal subunit
MAIRDLTQRGATESEQAWASLDRGQTLPAAWYTDAATYTDEQRRVFGRAWQYVGLTEQLAQPGDFFTSTIGETPVVVTRAEDGALRAFANVCRHRGAIVVREEAGHRSTLQCHYHAWTYNLDGSLRAAPGMKDEPDFDRTCYGLHALPCETWGPFIFVNPDRSAAPLADALGELPRLVAATGLDLGSIRRRVRRRYDIGANWKIVVDNYLECYHCPVAHPGFCDLIDTNDYVVTEHELFSTQSGKVKESAGRGDSHPYDVRGTVRDGFYAFLWPNFTLNIYPGPGNVSVNLFLPAGVDRTIAIYDYLFADAVTDAQLDEFVRFIDQVQDEDVALCESVQRGMRSSYYDGGRLMLARESALRHFQRLVVRALDDEEG